MRPTWRGGAVAIVVIALAVFGALTAIPELIAIACVGLAALLIAAGMTIAGRPGAFEAWVPARIERGTQADVRVTWTNDQRRRSGVRFTTRTGLTVPMVTWSTVPGEAAVPVSVDTRGPVVLGPWECSRVDPWGLFSRRLGTVPAQQTLITPRVHVVPLSSLPMAFADHSGVDDAGITTFASLREYVIGDEMRHIHWRSSAKAGTLMTRQYIDISRPHMSLVLIDDDRAYADADDFESAVDLTASIASVAQSAGFEVSILTASGERLRSGSSAAAVESLSYVDLHRTQADRRLFRLAEATTLVVSGHGDHGWWGRIPAAGVMRP